MASLFAELMESPDVDDNGNDNVNDDDDAAAFVSPPQINAAANA